VREIELPIVGDPRRPMIAVPINSDQSACPKRVRRRLVCGVFPDPIRAAIADPLQNLNLADRQRFISAHPCSLAGRPESWGLA
jgi:hypothetical protein